MQTHEHTWTKVNDVTYHAQGCKIQSDCSGGTTNLLHPTVPKNMFSHKVCLLYSHAATSITCAQIPFKPVVHNIQPKGHIWLITSCHVALWYNEKNYKTTIIYTTQRSYFFTCTVNYHKDPVQGGFETMFSGHRYKMVMQHWFKQSP